MRYLKYHQKLAFKQTMCNESIPTTNTRNESIQLWVYSSLARVWHTQIIHKSEICYMCDTNKKWKCLQNNCLHCFESSKFCSRINTNAESHKIISIRSKFYGCTCLLGTFLCFMFCEPSKICRLSSISPNRSFILLSLVSDNIDFDFLSGFYTQAKLMQA